MASDFQITDPNGQPILTKKERDAAQAMLKHEFKRGADTELKRINVIFDRVIKHFEKLAEKTNDDLKKADCEVSIEIVKMLRGQINA